MTPLEHLRLAVALVHGVPDAELRLHCGDDCVVVGRTTGTDPCRMRRAVATAIRGGTNDRAERITAIEIAGSLQHVAGGVFCHVGAGGQQRWITTLLSPHGVATVLAGLDGDDDAHHDAHHDAKARVRADAALGVTLVAIEPIGDHDRLDAIATGAAAAIYAEELRLAAARGGALPTPVAWEAR